MIQKIRTPIAQVLSIPGRREASYQTQTAEGISTSTETQKSPLSSPPELAAISKVYPVNIKPRPAILGQGGGGFPLTR
jgi:hypothetical protein